MRRVVSFRWILLGMLLIGACGMATSAAFAQNAAEPAESYHANPFRIVLQNIWDPVFWIILLCSLFGVALIIQAIIKNRRSVLMPETSTEQIREMIAQKQFQELKDFTENDDSFVSQALHAALLRAPAFSAMKEAMETSVAEQTAEQFRKIEYLNIIGNLGPLLGLMGTVLGMISAFQAMREQGTTDPAYLAGGISQALCHTFLGLLLAIPCLAAFGVLRTMVDRLTVQAALESEELLLSIKPQEAKPAGVPGAGPMRPAGMGVPQPAMPAAPAMRKAPVPPPPMAPSQR